jgi:hypothetical protein
MKIPCKLNQNKGVGQKGHWYRVENRRRYGLFIRDLFISFAIGIGDSFLSRQPEGKILLLY